MNIKVKNKIKYYSERKDNPYCFKFLNDEELNLIDKNSLEIKYNKGELICKQGSFANNILHITKGRAKLYIEHNDKKLILSFIGKKDLIALHSLFYKDILEYSSAVIEDSIVSSIDKKIFLQLINQNSKFAAAIIKTINKSSSIFFQRVISLTQKQLHGRLADAILHLANDVYGKKSFDFNLSRKEIADFTSMSTESAIRILKEFHNDKIINLKGKHISIISQSILEKLRDIG